MNRTERLLSYIDLATEQGLEIGPLDKMLVKRVPGRKIFYCDYASREELQRKSSADPNVTIELIPEIDFVAPKILPDTFDGMTFDYVIASHVMEHVPDAIGWLEILLSALKPGGKIILAVPDRRYTFDYIRSPSTAGQLVEAYLEQRSRPTFSQVYDGCSQAVKVETTQCWVGDALPEPLERYFTKDSALRLARDAFENCAHHDCHCWVFTYSSFLEVMAELKEIGMLDVKILHHAEPLYGENEFHIVLGHG